MNLSPVAIIEKHWAALADHQWQWEFMRRSDQFKDDTRRYLETSQKNRLFLATWSLPHPGDNCLAGYAYLSDYRTLLTDIMKQWLSRPEGQGVAERDLVPFAEALNGSREFYRALHPLVAIHRCGGTMRQGETERWNRSIQVKITLPKALKDRKQEIIQQIGDAGIVPFEHEIRPYPVGGLSVRLDCGTYSDRRVCLRDYGTKAAYEHAKWLMDCSLFTLTAAIPSSIPSPSLEAEQAISKAMQEVLNAGLVPVKFYERKRGDRAETYTRQIKALDVHRGLLKKRDYMDRYETNDDGYKNDLRGAKNKLTRLEGNAASRRRLFYEDHPL